MCGFDVEAVGGVEVEECMGFALGFGFRFWRYLTDHTRVIKDLRLI